MYMLIGESSILTYTSRFENDCDLCGDLDIVVALKAAEAGEHAAASEDPYQ